MNAAFWSCNADQHHYDNACEKSMAKIWSRRRLTSSIDFLISFFIFYSSKIKFKAENVPHWNNFELKNEMMTQVATEKGRTKPKLSRKKLKQNEMIIKKVFYCPSTVLFLWIICKNELAFSSFLCSLIIFPLQLCVGVTSLSIQFDLLAEHCSTDKLLTSFRYCSLRVVRHESRKYKKKKRKFPDVIK